MTSISGVAFACLPAGERSGAERSGAERQAVPGYGVTWQHVSRPRPDALTTLDPQQRPSAPRRWAT